MLQSGEDIATCPSCSLLIRVIYNLEEFMNIETIVSNPIAIETT